MLTPYLIWREVRQVVRQHRDDPTRNDTLYASLWLVLYLIALTFTLSTPEMQRTIELTALY